MKNNNQLRIIIITSVFIAITCVLTLAVRIPSPTNGYLNLGDCAVLLSGFLLGPIYGTIAGGVGSALADLLSGYPMYIIGTLIIKALMAFIVSLVPYFYIKKNKPYSRLGIIIGSILSELIMVLGYYLFESIFIGEGFVAAFAGVAGNLVQGAAGIIGAFFLIEIFNRIKFFDDFKKYNNMNGNNK